MSEEYKEGDIVQLTNTTQEAEVLEVVNVISDEHHGPLLRVNLLGVTPPMIQYYPERAVHLVRAAADTKGKKPAHEKKPAQDEKKPAHEEKPVHKQESPRHK